SSSAGGLANTYSYDSFGKLTASSGTLTNPFQYTGREFDSETEIYYYRARYYGPSTGRFISEDPIGFQGGGNFYRYVRNIPTTLIDPLGLADCVNGLRPLVLVDAVSYINRPALGTGTCVDLLKKTMGNYPTSTWVKGPAPDKNTPIGTFVATFYDDNGTQYRSESGRGHTGAWDGTFDNGGSNSGIVLIDQYRGRNNIDRSYIRRGGTRNYNSD